MSRTVTVQAAMTYRAVYHWEYQVAVPSHLPDSEVEDYATRVAESYGRDYDLNRVARPSAVELNTYDPEIAGEPVFTVLDVVESESRRR